MRLYAAARASAPDPALFEKPSSDFRGAPFWSWNGALDRGRLIRQFDDLLRMGMGGAHLHSRTGLRTPYLGPEFMAAVRACVEHAAARGALAWLYDEDRWPSGFAGGLVTCDPAHRLRYLIFSPRSYAETPACRLPGPATRVERWRTGQGRLLARYALRFADGRLAAATRLADDQNPPPDTEVWYAYLEACPPSAWYNNQGPADVLSPAAIRRFIETTHEAYARTVGDHFGATIPAIFTDEPLFTGKTRPTAWDDRADQALPWTDDLADTLRAAHGLDILDALPALFFDGLPETARARWCWHDHVAERFRQAFAEQIGAWCDAHGILMTGHLESEGGLQSQVARSGECMRFYQPMQLPGVDMLCDAIELSTVLQTRSVARQEGRPGVMSELYGVTNWDFDFAGHLRQGNWQAALGVTLRVHHLAWYTMAGEAKRDYPAAIDAHSPWAEQYPLIEDHFARLNTCLTRGRARCRIAMLHPVESVFVHWGQMDRNRAALAALEDRFQNLIRWLLHDQHDADFLAESLLPRQSVRIEGGALCVGAMRYEVLIVPPLATIRGTTLDVIERFQAAGGRVIWLGTPAPLTDARPSGRAAVVARGGDRLPFEREALLEWLEPWRDLRVRHADGRPVAGLLHQIREDGAARWLFVCATELRPGPGRVAIEVAGAWTAECWDTQRGRIEMLAGARKEGWSVFPAHLGGGGAVLLRLLPATSGSAVVSVAREAAPANLETGAWEAGASGGGEKGRLPDPFAFSLAESNTLLLDRAEGALDDGPFESDCEVLRLDNHWRQRLGWGKITSRIAQPWCEPAGQPAHRVRLRYRLDLRVALRGARLALERAGEARITLDGRVLPAQPDGFFVDEDIQTIPLPELAAGVRVLEIEWPYGPDRTLEWAYLLGDFGVRLAGRHAIVTAAPTALTWGDLTGQGLSFYGGNLIYRCRVRHAGGRLALQAHRFRAPLLRVAVDGRDAGAIYAAPYVLDLGEQTAGDHEIAITCYGSRWPQFGQWHHAQPETWRWWGPDSWRTEGPDWSEDYVPRPFGILSAPILR